MSTTSESNQPLVVIVSGGGPVGLTFSLHLTMMMGENVKIIIYEGRWFVDKDGKIHWQGEQQGKIRRDQVVTLQDHVIEQMPKYVQKGLFKNIDERVWPTSRNIAIREVEDRLFDLIQPFVQTGQIELVAENLDEQCEYLINGNFDVLVGTDGSNSFVRRYCNIQMISEGVEYACGVAYNIPKEVSPDDEPLHQSLNSILTVSQTRYLVNSSESRRGYLNIRLIKDEYTELQEYLKQFQSNNQSLDLTDSNKCPQHSAVWTIIRQGLEFFKIPPKYVFRVAPIEINVRHASIVIRELRFEIPDKNSSNEKKYKTALAFLAGDAAMNVHFWPGRGMNSGMKAAMALARCILRTCTRNNSIHIRLPLRFLDFLDYESFMARLRAREQQGRSLRVLINPVDEHIQTSYSYSHLSHCHKKYTKNLLAKLKETRDRLQERPEWPHQSRKITEDELKAATNRISAQAVAQLSLTNPWPTREMGGVEILVEDMFPYDLNNFLPLPSNATVVETPRIPTEFVRQRFLNLWVTGNEKNDSINKLISEIQNSPNFSSMTTNIEPLHRLFVVQTIDEAKEWIESNRTIIQEHVTQFKVVTSWKIARQQTAIDVIQAVRSQSGRVPILVFANKIEQTQAASEYPDVLITDEEYDLKLFVGVNQETQWNPGCEVSPSTTTLTKSLLLWVDSENNDLSSAVEIRMKYPSLDLHFREKYHQVKAYLEENLSKILQYKKVIVITHAFYRDESKSFLDVYQLFQPHQFKNLHVVLYTFNREDVLRRYPNRPEEIQIFTDKDVLLDFIDGHLNQ